MILWSTLVQMKNEVTVHDFYDVFRDWILSSRFTQIRPDEYPERLSEEMRFGTASQRVFVLKESDNKIGLRYEYEDRVGLWITEAVYSRSEFDSLCSIKLFCEMNGLSFKRPKSHTPNLIKLLIHRDLVRNDGVLHYNDKPKYVEESDVELVESLFTGKMQSCLPVIYVASVCPGDELVDAEMLAVWARGVAHVVVEPSRTFARRIADRIGRHQLPSGSIAVFIQGIMPCILFRRQPYESLSRLMARAVATAREAMTRVSSVSRLDFKLLRISHSVQKYVEAKGREVESSKYVAYCDEVVSETQNENERLKGENDALRKKLLRLGARQCIGNGECLFSTGDVGSLYDGELKDAILKVLNSGYSNLNSEGRYRRIIDSIKKNNELTGEQDRFRSVLNPILRDGGNITPREVAAIEGLGFSTSDEGKHYVFTNIIDPKVSFTVSKTPSCCKSGKNTISDLFKLMFQ